ncbi:MAG: hypothetical protein PHF57_13800 [Methanoregula sp.]|nr:hypothetical protein [Methanoregula sp.]
MQAVFSYIIGIFLLVISLITGGLAISETGTVQWGCFSFLSSGFSSVSSRSSPRLRCSLPSRS